MWKVKIATQINYLSDWMEELVIVFSRHNFEFLKACNINQNQGGCKRKQSLGQYKPNIVQMAAFRNVINILYIIMYNITNKKPLDYAFSFWFPKKY